MEVVLVQLVVVVELAVAEVVIIVVVVAALEAYPAMLTTAQRVKPTEPVAMGANKQTRQRQEDREHLLEATKLRH